MKNLIPKGVFVLLIFSQVCTYAQTGATFKQWGEETLTKIEQDFRMPGSNLYYENTSHGAPAFAWPIGIQLHALIAAGKTAQAEALANEIHSKYWCFVNNRWAYNATANACGDRYYDDNAWIAKALMELYKATNNTTYLSRARDVISFSMSGENPTNVSPGGGIKFHEGDTSGQCLCATAPTMTVNLMIYQATGVQQYLTDGQRLYNWVKANRFGYGPGYRGYENAVVTQSAMLLYKITGNAVYLDDARHMGLAMESSYINWNNHALNETGQWGGHDMTNAYVELYQLDGDVYWLNLVAGYLKFLHDSCKDANGRYPEVWSAAGTAGNPALLYQASAGRAFEKMGTTPGGAGKYPDPVAIFKDCNYSGTWSAGFFIGRYALADLVYHGVLDNDISSVKVQPGYRVTFYENDNFTGASIVKTADASCLVADAWNDRATSMVVEVVSPISTVYKDCNYTGRAVSLPVGDYNLAALQVRGINNNDISSLRVTAGYSIVLYDGDNFSGSITTLTGDNSCLVSSSWNDLTTSLKVRSGTCTPTAIVPYISVNGAAYQQVNSAALNAGGSIKLGPQPLTGGAWRWTGPNSYTATVREITISNIQPAQSGTYIATYTNTEGCQSTQSFNITVYPLNIATMYKDCNYTGTGVALALGDYDMFALNAKGIANDDVSSFRVTAGYEIVVYADYNFTGTSYTFNADDACLVDNGINDWISSLRVRVKSGRTALEAESTNNLSGEVNIYPVPSQDRVFIHHPQKDLSGVQVRIIDLMGREVGTRINSRDGIDISALNNGVYTLTFNHNGKVNILKFQKEKQ
jgi:hypothetical protein